MLPNLRPVWMTMYYHWLGWTVPLFIIATWKKKSHNVAIFNNFLCFFPWWSTLAHLAILDPFTEDNLLVEASQGSPDGPTIFRHPVHN